MTSALKDSGGFGEEQVGEVTSYDEDAVSGFGDYDYDYDYNEEEEEETEEASDDEAVKIEAEALTGEGNWQWNFWKTKKTRSILQEKREMRGRERWTSPR